MVEWNPKANELFACAAEIELPSDRQRFLDQYCGDDAPLRAEVELLLALNDKAGNFLNRPAVPMLTVEEAPVTERPGTRIGPYKLLEQLARAALASSSWPFSSIASAAKSP